MSKSSLFSLVALVAATLDASGQSRLPELILVGTSLVAQEDFRMDLETDVMSYAGSYSGMVGGAAVKFVIKIAKGREPERFLASGSFKSSQAGYKPEVKFSDAINDGPPDFDGGLFLLSFVSYGDVAGVIFNGCFLPRE